MGALTLRRSPHVTGRLRTRRGVSTLEMVVATTITLLVALGIARLLAATTQVTNATVGKAGVLTDSKHAVNALRDDIGTSQACDALHGPVDHLDRVELRLWQRTPAGTPRLVSWRVRGALLERSVLDASSCTPDLAGRTWVALRGRLVATPVDGRVFSPVIDGAAVAASCGDPAVCATVDAIGVDLVWDAGTATRRVSDAVALP